MQQLQEKGKMDMVSSSRTAHHLLFAGVLFLVISPWFSQVEVPLGIAMVPMLLRILWTTFVAATLPRLRISTMILLTTTAFLMSQTYPEQSKGRKGKVEQEKREAYSMFSAGYLSGFANIKDGSSSTAATFIPGTGTGCYNPGHYEFNTSRSYVKSDNNYQTGAISFARVIPQGKRETITFGLTGFTGSHSEDFSKEVYYNDLQTFASSRKESYQLAGIKPFIQFDGKYFGAGFGAVFGQLRKFSESAGDYSATESYSALPSITARIGSLTGLFADYSFGNQFVPTFPVMTHEIGLGLGIGRKGGILRAGTGTCVAAFVEPIVPIGSNFVLRPRIAWGNGAYLYNNTQTMLTSVSLHYKFGRKRVK